MLAEIAQIIPTIKPIHRPFHAIPIIDNGEKLIPLEKMQVFTFESPAPYLAAGADYGDANPFMLRETVAEKLCKAAESLNRIKKGWCIKIFDAYRPLSVQAYMVAHTFCNMAKENGLDPLHLSDDQRKELFAKTYRIWSPPNQDPKTPPPHSTGAAVDCTLVNEMGKTIDMGSAIDLNSDISNPDYFLNSKNQHEIQCHQYRIILRDIMQEQGFLQHPAEWWHFSYGDQLWVWLQQQKGHITHKNAIYGRFHTN
jgi:D-alanyl-D-alanine dipeptidase